MREAIHLAKSATMSTQMIQRGTQKPHTINCPVRHVTTLLVDRDEMPQIATESSNTAACDTACHRPNKRKPVEQNISAER